MRFSISLFIAVSALWQADAATEPEKDEVVKKPNIILILADDLGITDITSYAAHFTGEDPANFFYETPNLNQLMMDGVSFEHAYATQLCSPTRAALMTGKLAPTLGFTTATPPKTRTFYSAGEAAPEGVHPLNAFEHGDPILMEQPYRNAYSQTALPSGSEQDAGADETTIAEALTDYESVFIGKWHLGGHGAKGYTPDDQGFRSIAYLDAGGSPYFDWRGEWLSTERPFKTMPQDRLYAGTITGGETGEPYLTDDLTARAVRYINDRDSDDPFFMYFAHFAVHTPIQGKQDLVDYYTQKPNRGVKGQRDPIYAAMLHSLDDSIGAIRRSLEESGQAANTYIILLSDNGGVDWQLGGQSPKVRPHHRINISDNLPPTSNVPFTGGKATLYEGGVRVPLVVVGPSVSSAGQWSPTPVDVTDIFPTILDVAGHSPEEHYARDGFFGRSLTGFFSDGEQTYDKDRMYWHYPYNVIIPDIDDQLAVGPHSAIRRGDFKLIYDWHGQVHLFDVVNDPFERVDLAYRETELAQSMLSELKDWITENVRPEYIPQLDPEYDAATDLRGPVAEPWIVPGLND